LIVELQSKIGRSKHILLLAISAKIDYSSLITV